MVTSQYNVPDYLDLDMKLSGKLLGSVHKIIYVLALHWHS